ncbi:helix-turn-helix domain-containing protein [Marinigracilibium pacificum]|uniref:Helix-turn-helix domain-containing protein n=1 Tax=Marinigracilibium pacificum TaxID=2729599 RepID=A0A848IWU3_9BACT|nr:helix-turn-helix domain-containing protein [Marinigracilibium pacificum]NMM47751.1 helix-turn-helix domain-containing protein [Marinigracilibium pacificum]
MQEIGKKIKEIRKKKGLSQEELADSAKVNLRTIQRIEKNESEPRGTTLNLICEALEINTEEILDYGKQEDNNYLFIIHLSVLAFLAIPIGNIILPLILWMNKKERIIGLKKIGANILNFQIIWSVIAFISFLSFGFLKILHIPYHYVPFYIFLGLNLLNIILPIVFSFKAKNGKINNYYPNPITIIR